MNKLKWFLLSLVVAAASLVFFSFKFKQRGRFTPSSLDTISVQGGLVSGGKSKDGSIRILKGIPFAAPPVGNLRWKAPQPVVK